MLLFWGIVLRFMVNADQANGVNVHGIGTALIILGVLQLLFAAEVSTRR
jgi:hypothetical protein